MVRPSEHYGREKHEVTRDISCHIHPELSTWIITSKSKKPLSKETQNQMESYIQNQTMKCYEFNFRLFLLKTYKVIIDKQTIYRVDVKMLTDAYLCLLMLSDIFITRSLSIFIASTKHFYAYKND